MADSNAARRSSVQESLANREARDFRIYTLVLLAFSALLGALSFWKVSAAVLALSLYCALYWFLHSRAALRLRHVSQESSAAGDSQGQGRAAATEHIGSTDTVLEVSFGEVHPNLKFVIPGELSDTDRQCAEELHALVQSARASFLEQFEEFKRESSARYPESAKEIGTLAIDYLIVVPGDRKRDCVAEIHFLGEVGQVWFAEYGSKGFLELVWL